MADWKTALAALVQPGDESTADETLAGGVEEAPAEAAPTRPRNRQELRLNMERAGRGGKTVVVIRGFVGTDKELAELCRLLKQKCGIGGSAKQGELIMQGNHRQRLLEVLQAEGYTRAR